MRTKIKKGRLTVQGRDRHQPERCARGDGDHAGAAGLPALREGGEFRRLALAGQVVLVAQAHLWCLYWAHPPGQGGRRFFVSGVLRQAELGALVFHPKNPLILVLALERVRGGLGGAVATGLYFSHCDDPPDRLVLHRPAQGQVGDAHRARVTGVQRGSVLLVESAGPALIAVVLHRRGGFRVHFVVAVPAEAGFEVVKSQTLPHGGAERPVARRPPELVDAARLR